MGNEKVLESLRRNECVRKPRVGGAWVLAGGSGHPGARRGWSGAPTFSGGGVAGGLAVNMELCGPAAVHLLELLGDLWLP